MEWNLTSSCVSVLLGDLGYCLQFVFVLNKAAETQSNSFWQGSSFSSCTSPPWDLDSLLSLEGLGICNFLHLLCPLRYSIFPNFKRKVGLTFSHVVFHTSSNFQENKSHLIATPVQLMSLLLTLHYINHYLIYLN